MIEMTQNPMVAEVNRLIANIFAAGESVAFPSVGTLFPLKRAARRISKRAVLPPLREIDFKSDLVGKTLAERLAAAARCPIEQAEEIYGRWLNYTLKEGVLTIEGVGVLQQKHFRLDPAFDVRLNPQGRKPIAVRARRRGLDWPIWLGLAAVVAAVVIGFYGYREWGGTLQMPWKYAKVEKTVTEVAKTAEQPAEIPAPVAEEVAPAEQHTAETPAPVTTKPTSAPTAPRATGVQTMQSGHYYVVLGVYSTVENAERALVAAAEKGLSGAAAYYFGQKFMVAAYSAADQESCAAFRRAQEASFPDLWVYKAR